MKKPITKAEIRAQLERETERFLREGGSVQNIPRGLSGKEPSDSPSYLHRQLFAEPRTPRTPVPEVIAAIEARRRARVRRRATPRRTRLPEPRRRIIYDDFGEPLRKVWVED